MTTRFDVLSDAYRSTMAETLKRTKFRGQPPSYFDSPQFENDLTEETHRRYLRFADHVVPWINHVFPLSPNGSTVLDIGGGSGISALAFAPYAKRVLYYDIEPDQIAAARARLDYFDVTNVEFQDEYFDSGCRFIQSGETADVALFIAVLEHMTFAELESALSAAWRALRPGGILVVVETPNRLCPYDYHTSWLPWFQSLPMDVRLRYYDRSPREHLVADLDSVPAADRDMRLTRWGSGISYHELEIVLGPSVHDWIVADGHEPILAPIAPRYPTDEILEFAFSKMPEMQHINRAFTRWFLYFVLRKPTTRS